MLRLPPIGFRSSDLVNPRLVGSGRHEGERRIPCALRRGPSYPPLPGLSEPPPQAPAAAGGWKKPRQDLLPLDQSGWRMAHAAIWVSP
jgi:hypothetical protein